MTDKSSPPIEQNEVLDLLSSLVDKSLVVYEEDAPDRRRYRLSETLRDYARERPEGASETAELRNRHCDYFLYLAEIAEPLMIGADQAEWFDNLETEHDNFRSSLSWAREACPLTALRIAAAIWRFWFIRGYQTEGRGRILDALARADEKERREVRATALNGAGNLSWSLTDYPAANAFLHESLNIRQELGDGQGVASSFNNLGNVAFAQGDFAAAGPLYEESLAIRKELDDKRGIAMAIGNLGRLAEAQGRFAEARAHYEQSLELHREHEDIRGVAISLEGIGNILISQGRLDEARQLQEEGLALRVELGNKWGIASSLHPLGEIARLKGDYAAAEKYYAESLVIRRDLGDKLGIAESLEAFASLNLVRGIPISAATFWGAAERLREEIGTPVWPKEVGNYQREVDICRSSLAEETFASSWATGRDLGADRAIAIAVEDARG